MASRTWSKQDVMQLISQCPVRYGDVHRVADECAKCLQSIKSLTPKVGRKGSFCFLVDFSLYLACSWSTVFPDGQMYQLLFLDGTIPMYYNAVKYNCPIQVWIHTHFPQYPPYCWVVPTPTMRIRDRHIHVGPDGQVYHPYLSEWSASSSLKVLCETLSQLFSKMPPVFSVPASEPAAQSQPPRPANTSARPPPEPTPAVGRSNADEDEVLQQVLRASEDAAEKERIEKEAREEEALRRALRSSVVLEENEHNELVALVTSKVQVQCRFVGSGLKFDENDGQAKLEQMRRKQSMEVEREQAKHQAMQERKAVILKGERELNAELDQLNALLNDLQEAELGLDACLREHNQRMRDPIESSVLPSDVLARQLMDCVAEDRAIEDAMYKLDGALGRGKIGQQAYVKMIFDLSRQQYTRKELAARIVARRRHVLNPAASGGSLSP